MRLHPLATLPWLPLTATLLLGACSSKTAAELLISPEQENMLGAQLKMQLEIGTPEEDPIQYLTTPADVRTYVLGLAEKVVALGRMERPEFSWKVEVINDPTQVNAFATPGGYLYVFTGLLLAAENEAEVIGVMGHEVGHVLARHFARRLVQTYGLQALIAIGLGEDQKGLATLAATLLAQGYLLRHSREAETESDEYGARLMSQAGYDPNALGTFFSKLAMMQGSVGVLKYLMGHPPAADREAHIRDYVMKNKLPIGATNREMFQMMRARVPTTPPPPRPRPDGGTAG